MEKPKLIIGVGLQRAGNHAVLGWVASLFSEAAFHNNQHHDLFADPDALAACLGDPPAPCTIVSFEDAADRTAAPRRRILDGIAALPPEIADRFEVHRLAILRDPYNTWASRVAANAQRAKTGGRLTSDPSWDLFRTNWLQLAGCVDDPAWQVVLFNRWTGDAPYRREICATLGGCYSETALEAVPMQGGGSSFDGVPRPTYGGMLRRPGKYLSGSFLRRLATRPAHYARRLVAPRMSGRDLAVDRRWTTLEGRDEGAALFADVELRAVTARILGPAALPPEGTAAQRSRSV